MKKRIGVIDIGTNTFHLLIVDWDSKTRLFSTLLRKRVFVKLGESKLDLISDAAYQRGVEALTEFKEILIENDCSMYQALGTAAIRNATNADQFINEVKAKLNIDIQKISGDREANLIYKGIQMSYPFDEKPCLIMDIGGGSVEFIIANKVEVYYAESFLVGAAVMRNLFHTSEPILPDQVNALHAFLEVKLSKLKEQLQKYQPLTLIGASGTFDVLRDAFASISISPTCIKLDTSKLPDFIRDSTRKSLLQRMDCPKIPDSRADLIVVALLLIEHILKMHKFDQIVVTEYAMKEGILKEMIVSVP